MWLEVIQIILIGVSGYFTAWSYVAIRKLSAHVDGPVWDQVSATTKYITDLDEASDRRIGNLIETFGKAHSDKKATLENHHSVLLHLTTEVATMKDTIKWLPPILTTPTPPK